MKKPWPLIVALLIMLTLPSCKKDKEDTAAPPFRISNLQYQPSTTVVLVRLPLVINGTIDYINAQKGVAELRLHLSTGAELKEPLEDITASGGTLAGSVSATMPAAAGTYSFELWLVDGEGNSSNKLSGSLTLSVNDAATEWIQVSQSYDLHKVIWANNKYLAVGESGRVLTSTNGVAWSEQASGTGQALYSVCWTGTQYVAAGNNHTVLTSPDGTTWTSRLPADPNVYFRDVTGSGNNLTVVGTHTTDFSSEILHSTDGGAHWSSAATRVTGGKLNGIAWSGSLYVAVGEAFNYPVLLTSPNGVDWTNRSGIFDDPGPLRAITWSGSRFVVVGSTHLGLSPDGLHWDLHRDRELWANSILWTGNKYLMTSSSGIYTSPDGTSWTKTYDTPPGVNSVAWSGNQYAAVGPMNIMLSP